MKDADLDILDTPSLWTKEEEDEFRKKIQLQKQEELAAKCFRCNFNIKPSHSVFPTPVHGLHYYKKDNRWWHASCFKEEQKAWADFKPAMVKFLFELAWHVKMEQKCYG